MFVVFVWTQVIKMNIIHSNRPSFKTTTHNLHFELLIKYGTTLIYSYITFDQDFFWIIEFYGLQFICTNKYICRRILYISHYAKTLLFQNNNFISFF